MSSRLLPSAWWVMSDEERKLMVERYLGFTPGSADGIPEAIGMLAQLRREGEGGVMAEQKEPVDQQGLAAAREWARWYIGDPAWGDEIVRAYLNPENAMKVLEAEQDGDDS